MKNAVSLIVVIAVAIALGVALSVKMSGAGSNSNSDSSMVGQQLAHIIEALGKIDQRLTEIEKQQSKMQDIVDQARNAAQRYAQQPPQPGQGAGAQQAPQPPQEDFNKVYDIPVGASPIRGNKNAKATITMFADIQCPFCERFYGPVKEVMKIYPNDVKFIIKNFPLSFHPNAKPAAKAALAANDQGKYFEMIDLMLTQGADLSENGYKAMAQKIGLNVDKFTKDLKDKDAAYEAAIQKDLELGGQVQVMGTPTFFLNGKKTMARDLNGFKTEVDKIIQGK